LEFNHIESFDFAMSTPAASAPYGGDPPTIENRKVPLRRANVAYRSREYLSDKEVIPSYIFRGDGQVIDLDAIVAGGVGLTEFSGIWAYSPLLDEVDLNQNASAATPVRFGTSFGL